MLADAIKVALSPDTFYEGHLCTHCHSRINIVSNTDPSTLYTCPVCKTTFLARETERIFLVPDVGPTRIEIKLAEDIVNDNTEDYRKETTYLASFGAVLFILGIILPFYMTISLLVFFLAFIRYYTYRTYIDVTRGDSQ